MMKDDLSSTMQISAAGMKAQGLRMRVIAENIANAGTTAANPGEEPYRRQVITFKEVFDKELGTKLVDAGTVRKDYVSDFQRRFDPSHPSADAQGYVLMPNVRTLVETMDMREAQRSYEANLAVIDQTRTMLARTLDLLRN